jgi:hypothetical protein
VAKCLLCIETMIEERRASNEGRTNSSNGSSPEHYYAGSSSSSGGGSTTTKSSALNWFDAHPLVATVLYLLGADVTERGEEKHATTGKGGDKRAAIQRSLSWRDDRGGSIVMDDAAAGQHGRTRFKDSAILHGHGSSNNEDKDKEGGVLLKRNTMQYHDRDADPARDSFTDSPNNNYGFYVTISPSQEHKFPRLPRGDDIDS